MPALDDDLTEEQKRQALLEDLYGEESRLPKSAIPADNVSFTNGADGQIEVDVPEGYAPPVERPMIGDEQYQNELARAQRGNGFIAAEVSNNGELLQPGVDPNYRSPEQLIIQDKLATAAKRFKGQQMYASLIKGGASPAEAIRLAGADMFAANPAGNVSAVLHSQPKPALPTTITPQALRDEKGNIIAHGVIGPSGGVQIIRPRAEVKEKMPADVVESQKKLDGEIVDVRRDLERAKRELEKDPGNNDAARRALNYQNQLTKLREQSQVGSTNWMNRGESRPKVSEKQEEPKKANEVQRVTRDGRLAIFDANTKSFLRYAD